MSTDATAALQEILRRAQAIQDGQRFVGGPRAVAFDLGSIAGRALGVEVRAANEEQKTWHPLEQREPQKRRKQQKGHRR
jgi:hypothetical protein